MEKPSHIIIHQAYYGEVRRSHDKIASTIQDHELHSSLVAFTDRPGMLTAGPTPEPYYSGAPFGDYYVFTLSFPDMEASRGGLVFTHALMVRKTDLPKIHSIARIFELFVAGKTAERKNLQPLEIPCSDLVVSPNPEIPPYVPAVLHGMLSTDDPVIFCGSLAQFSVMLDLIWQAIPSSLRKNFTYSAGFGPSDMDQPKNLLHYSTALCASLKGTPHITADDPGPLPIADPVTDYLLGQPSDNEFGLFLNAAEAEILDWKILRMAVKALPYYRAYAANPGSVEPSSLRQLFRYLGAIVPDPRKGQALKETILQKFAAYLMDGRENQIKAIKNLPVDAYKNGVELLSRHLGISITSAFQDPIDFVAVNWSDTVISWNKADAAWWRDTLAAELSKAGQLLSPQAAENSWKILGHSREAAIAFFPWIAATRSAEKALLMCPPAEFSPTIAEALAPATKDRRWFGLHAFLVLHYRDAPAAALEQLGWETENPDSAFAGTQRIAKSLSDEVMRYLLKTSGHSVFVEEYAARTMAKPDLLSFLEIRLPVWRLVWLESIQRTGNLQHGIADVKSTVSQVLQLLAAEEDVPVKLLEFIADSEFADLTDLPHRSGIWANLASAVRPKFLKATTGTIVRQLIEGQIAGDNLELPIREYYSSREFLSVFLRNPLGRIDSVITLYENIVGAGESQDRLLVEYIRAYRGSLNNAVSAKFGKVLEKHGLSKAALEVFHRAKSEADFRPALIGARSVLNLGLWERFRYGYLLGEQQSAESVRQVWLDLAIRLYPLGPDQNHIWERAGGNPAKLGSAGSREDHWRDAFRLLRDGGGGKDISHWQLMKEMKKDFPENDELKEIQKYLSK